jgi:cytochrome oxidase Cu insertion factor (SCO1/SenC/PrrC family)
MGISLDLHRYRYSAILLLRIRARNGPTTKTSVSPSLPFISFILLISQPGDELANKSIGRPSIGGPFSLLDTESKPFTEKDLLGKWTLVYFGFTHCPDICPEELDKMGQAVDLVGIGKGKEEVLPLFVSVDPARDSVEQVRKYITGESGSLHNRFRDSRLRGESFRER